MPENPLFYFILGENQWKKARQGATTSQQFCFKKLMDKNFELRVYAENEIGFGETSDVFFIDSMVLITLFKLIKFGPILFIFIRYC